VVIYPLSFYPLLNHDQGFRRCHRPLLVQEAWTWSAQVIDHTAKITCSYKQYEDSRRTPMKSVCTYVHFVDIESFLDHASPQMVDFADRRPRIRSLCVADSRVLQLIMNAIILSHNVLGYMPLEIF